MTLKIVFFLQKFNSSTIKQNGDWSTWNWKPVFFYFCNVSSIHKKKNDQQVIENLFPYLKNAIKARLKAIKNCKLWASHSKLTS